MVIGIDASRAFGVERTGTENYSYHVITHMLRLLASKKHIFVLFTRPNAIIPDELVGYSNVIIKTINQKYLWTQLGLAVATWRRAAVTQDYLDVLWVPAHTLPILRAPWLETVVTIHGLEYRWLVEYNNLLQRWYLPLSTFYAAKAATKLICVSEATKRDLISEVEFDIEKCSVIWEGVDDSRISVKPYIRKAVLEKYGIEKGKYVLFVGTVQPRKNLGALIRAFAKFYSSHNEYKLVIAGGIGWRAENDLSLPEELDIPDAVIFTGRVSQAELQALYLGAMMYVQPSWTEGFGLPVLEAMRSRVPVVVSDGGALPEVVGEGGVVIPLKLRTSSHKSNKVRNFVERLAEAMERVVADNKLRKMLITRGLKRVNELTWEKTAKATLKILVGERV